MFLKFIYTLLPPPLQTLPLRNCYRYMANINIHILHCGHVHTSPYFPFDTGGGMLKVAGIGVPRREWIWMP